MQNNLQIDSLSKSYNGVEAVDNISFAIKKMKLLVCWDLMDVEKQQLLV
jgi:ABC-type multidrug transport system ATPase subunit